MSTRKATTAAKTTHKTLKYAIVTFDNTDTADLSNSSQEELREFGAHVNEYYDNLVDAEQCAQLAVTSEGVHHQAFVIQFISQFEAVPKKTEIK